MSPVVQSGPGIAPTATNARVYAPSPGPGGRASNVKAAGDIAAALERAKTIHIRKPIYWSTDLWTVALIEEINAKLHAQHRKLIPLTENNITNIERIMGAEVAGQQGGFLRDNNPLNVGTFCGEHAPLYGAVKTIAPFGPDTRCSGQAVYLNVFATPLDGVKGTVTYLEQYGSSFIRALQHNAPPAMFAAASPWGAGDVGTPLKETSRAVLVPKGGYRINPNAGNYQAGVLEKLGIIAKGGADVLFAPGFGLRTFLNDIQGHPGKGLNPEHLPNPATAGGALNPLSDLVSLGQFFSKLNHIGWVRVGIFLGGAALVIGGTAIYVGTSAGPRILESRVP